MHRVVFLKHDEISSIAFFTATCVSNCFICPYFIGVFLSFAFQQVPRAIRYRTIQGNAASNFRAQG
jgi:hypothetical protein